MARCTGPSTCSFCSKDRDQTQRRIAGPSGVYICAECVNGEIVLGVGATVLARTETLSPRPPSMPLLGVGATVLARTETLSPRPPSMPLRGWRCVTAPRLIGEYVYCAPAKRTPSHCLRCQPRRALCPARTTSSGGLRRQGRYRWEWQFHGALSSTASTNSTPGLKNSGLAGGDGEESNSTPPVR
jgi:hypothetical protein